MGKERRGEENPYFIRRTEQDIELRVWGRSEKINYRVCISSGYGAEEGTSVEEASVEKADVDVRVEGVGMVGVGRDVLRTYASAFKSVFTEGEDVSGETRL